MTVTFLVEINLDDVATILEVAQEIEDDLSNNFDVLSVKPWARPTSNPLLPTQQQQQTGGL